MSNNAHGEAGDTGPPETSHPPSSAVPQVALPAEGLTQRLLTKAEVAAYVQCTARCIDNWMKRGYLPYFKIGRVVRFKLSDVDAHLEDHFRVMRRRRYSSSSLRS